MSIAPIRQQYICYNCGLGRIGKLITQRLKNPDNYLEGVLVTTTFIYLNCQIVFHQETVEINI